MGAGSWKRKIEEKCDRVEKPLWEQGFADGAERECLVGVDGGGGDSGGSYRPPLSEPPAVYGLSSSEPDPF